MYNRAQLLVLLTCVAAIARVALAGVQINTEGADKSVSFCCAVTIQRGAKTGQNCIASLSGTAAMDSTTRASRISQCELTYGIGKLQGGHVIHKVCLADGDDCTDPPGGVEDPKIVGLDGRNYLLWGKLNTTYNLLSERNHAINIHLFHPENVQDKQALYIDAAGFLIHSARLTVRIVRPTPKDQSRLVLTVGSDEITYPGRPIDRAVDSLTSYSFRSSQKVTISSRDLVVSVYIGEDYYLNVLVDEVAASWSDVHGVMGQTHADAFKLRYNYARGEAVGELPSEIYAAQRHRNYQIKGKEDDYIVSGLLKTDDKFSRFVAQPTPVSRKLFNDKVVAAQKNEDRVKSIGGVLGA